MRKLLLLVAVFFFAYAQIQATPVQAKAYEKRVELLGYLRTLEPIVKNFRGNDKDGKPAALVVASGMEGERVRKYEEIKRLFQEATLYFNEGNHVSAYRRYLEAQLNLEQLLEELSQFYIESTEDILKIATEKKNDNSPDDKSLVDISVEYGKTSTVQKRYHQDREAPYIKRNYDPKDYHWTTNKYNIEKLIETGYRFLGEAKTARISALKIENHFEKHQKMQPEHRKYRIESYLAVIERCRDSKANAFDAFKLKYPYDNYELFFKDEKRSLEGVAAVWGGNTGRQGEYLNNPYIDRKNPNPVFDERIPEKFRRDYADLFSRIYEEFIDEYLKLKYDPTYAAKLAVEYKEEKPAAKTDAPPAAGGSPSATVTTPAGTATVTPAKGADTTQPAKK